MRSVIRRKTQAQDPSLVLGGVYFVEEVQYTDWAQSPESVVGPGMADRVPSGFASVNGLSRSFL